MIRLEEQVVNFRQGLYQEAIFISSSKSRENGLDSCYDHFSSHNAKNPDQNKAIINAYVISNSLPSKRWSLEGNQNLPSNCAVKEIRSPKKPNSAQAEEHRGKENQLNANSAKNVRQSPLRKAQSFRMLDFKVKCPRASSSKDDFW